MQIILVALPNSYGYKNKNPRYKQGVYYLLK